MTFFGIVGLFFLHTFRELREIEPFSLRKWVVNIAEETLPLDMLFDPEQSGESCEVATKQK